MAKGVLIPIGGNEDKGVENISENYTLDFIQIGILSTVVKECGGTDSHILVIPTASSIQKVVGEGYLAAFARLGCNNVEVLFINSVEEAENEYNINALKKCQGVMFSGGDQSRIVEFIGNTLFHEILNERYEKEHFVIAGTSAGAMCMSKEMIAGGNITESLIKGNVKHGKGMGFVPELIIDSHFIKRGRFGRLTQAVAKYQTLLGIGLSEDTGIVIKNDSFRVIGSGMVIVFDPSELTHNNMNSLEEKMPMTMTNLKVHVLAFGDRFDLKTREIEVMGLEEYKALGLFV
jgi:cyanophycinase